MSLTGDATKTVKIEWEGVLGKSPSFVEWPLEVTVAISRIESVPVAEDGGDFRVTLRNEDSEVIHALLDSTSDDASTCRKPLRASGTLRAEVSGAQDRRVCFIIRGRVLDPDEV